MNIEIANRLVQLRKSNNLSQEALAEKLGISRQAVSKWERAEASPDTDNIILLARLYGVSLDELLKTEDEIPEPRDTFYEETEVWGDGVNPADGGDGGDFAYTNCGAERATYEGDAKENKEGITQHRHFPVALIIIVTYILIGSVFHAWHPGWLIVFLIPIWDSLLEAIEKRDAARFAYPVLMVLLYLCLGFFAFLWHPGWVVFLTIPVYYSMIEYFKDRSRRKKEDDLNEEQ